MTEADVECILQRARELYPGVQPRIITDHGPPFIAKDFKEFIRLTGMTHVRTSPYYPLSNGRIERYHRTIKDDTIRPGQPSTSALGYITPHDFLQGRSKAIHEARDRKHEKGQRPQSREASQDLPGRSMTLPVQPLLCSMHPPTVMFTLSQYNAFVGAGLSGADRSHPLFGPSLR